MESLFDEAFALDMPDSSESTGLHPNEQCNQATAPGFQPSGGIASTTRALTHAVRSQYLAKHKGEDRATSVSSNMQTLMVQADKECLDWIRATIVEEIEKRIPCEASSHRATADRREYRKGKKRAYDRRWKASNIRKCT